ncbi:MAG: carbon-nitrogen hydrolase family protein [Desulfobacterales bacterium]
MRVTVCEMNNQPDRFAQDWRALCDHVKSAGSDLVLLPEMPFYPWLASTQKCEPERWQSSVQDADQWISRLGELAPVSVLGTRPVVNNGRHLNEGFCWDDTRGYRAVHYKYYLPDEEGFWEASWYERGKMDFSAVECNQAKVGFLICSELWFNQHARDYARQGVHLLVCPRATPKASVEKWIAGGRTAAVVSGAYCLSSNFSGARANGPDWGGAGWIVEPEEGAILGLTSEKHPFITLKIDLQAAEKAKGTYPRYVRS